MTLAATPPAFREYTCTERSVRRLPADSLRLMLVNNAHDTKARPFAMSRPPHTKAKQFVTFHNKPSADRPQLLLVVRRSDACCSTACFLRLHLHRGIGGFTSSAFFDSFSNIWASINGFLKQRASHPQPSPPVFQRFGHPSKTF